MPKSIRKHIRKEKARIRREFLSRQEQEKQVQDLLLRFTQNSLTKQNKIDKVQRKTQ